MVLLHYLLAELRSLSLLRGHQPLSQVFHDLSLLRADFSLVAVLLKAVEIAEVMEDLERFGLGHERGQLHDAGGLQRGGQGLAELLQVGQLLGLEGELGLQNLANQLEFINYAGEGLLVQVVFPALDQVRAGLVHFLQDQP